MHFLIIISFSVGIFPTHFNISDHGSGSESERMSNFLRHTLRNLSPILLFPSYQWWYAFTVKAWVSESSMKLASCRRSRSWSYLITEVSAGSFQTLFDLANVFLPLQDNISSFQYQGRLADTLLLFNFNRLFHARTWYGYKRTFPRFVAHLRC